MKDKPRNKYFPVNIKQNSIITEHQQLANALTKISKENNDSYVFDQFIPITKDGTVESGVIVLKRWY